MARGSALRIVREMERSLEQVTEWYEKSSPSFIERVFSNEKLPDPEVATRRFEEAYIQAVGLAVSCMDHLDAYGQDTATMRKELAQFARQPGDYDEGMRYLRLLAARLRGLALTEERRCLVLTTDAHGARWRPVRARPCRMTRTTHGHEAVRYALLVPSSVQADGGLPHG